MAKKENSYQSSLVKKLKAMFPGCMVTKLDSGHTQGIPDLLILFKDKWATLEVKRSAEERKKPRPNQEYYVKKMDDMSFSRFIFPENEKEVLSELSTVLKS